ncbi:MAG: hypothetical protein E6I27_17790 [Chloroflexi bacterium]|nr:MAG: hypothetical protein E6I27_17790 [Chloroflexota bacterium]
MIKTVGSAGFNPNLGLVFGVNATTAIPADALTYTATVNNTGSTMTLAGVIRAGNNGNIAATVADYYDEVEYYTSANKTWNPLAGKEASQPGYTPVVRSPITTGMVLTLSPVVSQGVTYPASGDPVLGTQITQTTSWPSSA